MCRIAQPCVMTLSGNNNNHFKNPKNGGFPDRSASSAVMKLFQVELQFCIFAGVGNRNDGTNQRNAAFPLRLLKSPLLNLIICLHQKELDDDTERSTISWSVSISSAVFQTIDLIVIIILLKLRAQLTIKHRLNSKWYLSVYDAALPGCHMIIYTYYVYTSGLAVTVDFLLEKSNRAMFA